MKCDVLVIGAGPGGYEAAYRIAKKGKKVILADKNYWLGGVCLQHGCIPSKALISVAENYEKIQELKDKGFEIKNCNLNIKKLQKWKNEIISKLTKDIEGLLKAYKVAIIKASAKFESSTTARVGNETIEFEKAIIATGSVPIEIPSFKFDEKQILSSKGALNISTMPKDVVVIGGGYIGLEMGMVYAMMGAEVHILEAAPEILSIIDQSLVEIVKIRALKIGVKFHTNTKAEGYSRKGKKIIVNAGKNKISCDIVMVAVGRKPNSKNIGLEKTQVGIDEHGFVQVNSKLQTNDPNIYAIGDVAGQPMLAHKARRDAIVAANNLTGIPDEFDNRAIPAVIFTNPEIATVGMTEEEAKSAGYEPVKGKFLFAHLGRALAGSGSEGFMEVIIDKKTHLILGAQGVGPRMSDLISEASLAIEMAAYAEDVAYTIHAHPTYPEVFMEACAKALEKA